MTPTPPRRPEQPIGAAIALEELDLDPHAVHRRLRPTEPVSWLPCLEGWLVTSHALATQAMRDAVTFTVDDPRFTTARVIGPSMLSLDGERHERHRAPFTGPFRPAAVRARFAEPAARHAHDLIVALRPSGRAELRRGFAGPMAAAIVTRALGMAEDDIGPVLGAYDAIVASVSRLSAGAAPTAEGGEAFAWLRERLRPVIAGDPGDSLLAAAANPADGAPALSTEEITSDAAVLLFGGIETTEGMIANAAAAILRHDPEPRRVAPDAAALSAAIDESLRLEPAAAVIDRYATRDTVLGDAHIAAGDLVRVSIAGANRDPAVFPDPDRYDPARPNARRHLAFAQGPHVCVGVHLARLEARVALGALFELPGLALDPDRPSPTAHGLIFRKPEAVHVRWEVSRNR